jgi:predicted outer membrane protein
MRKRCLAALAAVSLLGAAPSAAPAALTGSDAPVAHAACKRAIIGGHTKCIARGQFCARSHARDYRRYGLSCTNRDYNGRYHLR